MYCLHTHIHIYIYIYLYRIGREIKTKSQCMGKNNGKHRLILVILDWSINDLIWIAKLVMIFNQKLIMKINTWMPCQVIFRIKIFGIWGKFSICGFVSEFFWDMGKIFHLWFCFWIFGIWGQFSICGFVSEFFWIWGKFSICGFVSEFFGIWGKFSICGFVSEFFGIWGKFSISGFVSEFFGIWGIFSISGFCF